ncbi:MAG: hypothetical protein NUV82_03190 [Candidatus Komeilibacteria bacterium]|nr:hypothetical protein [Candidatus Komeilibacteria bacterium]
MTKDSLIRTVYLYLFALVGLAVLVIGLGQLVDLALKAWVFTYADNSAQYSYVERPLSPSVDYEKQRMDEYQRCTDVCQLSEAEKTALAQWAEDYDTWRENMMKNEQVDYRRQERERQASRGLSMVIIGLPLYLYHWSVIKKDRRAAKIT